MDILSFLFKKGDISRVYAGLFNPLSAKEENLIIYGSGREIKKAVRKLEKTSDADNFFTKKFAILSGDIDEISIAIPIDSRKTVFSALTQLCLAKGTNFKSSLIIVFLRLLNIPFLYSFIFRKQFCVLLDDQVDRGISFISQKLETIPKNISFSIYKGSRKYILPIFDFNSENDVVYAKIYSSQGESSYYGENEAKALRFLEKLSFENAETPGVIASDYSGPHLVEIISSKRGLKNFKGINEAHTGLIKEIAEKTGKRKLFKDSFFFQAIQQEFSFIKNKLNESEFFAVRYFYEKAMRLLENKNFLFSFARREFAYFELLSGKDKNFCVDWEHSREEFPPFFDLYNLLLSEQPCRKGDFSEMHARNIEIVFFEKGGKAKGIIKKFLNYWNISAEDSYLFFLLYLVDQLHIYLHVDSYESGAIVTKFFKKMYDNESGYEKKWLKHD
jgi:hypothetical protein